MKNLPSFRLKTAILLFVVTMFSFMGISQAPSAIMWDKYVGCQIADFEYVYDFNVENQDFCLKVCATSTVTYQLIGGDPLQWSTVFFTASGGTIINSTNTDVTVQWGGQGWGSLSIDIQMLNGGRFQEQICIEKTPKPRPFFHIAPTLDDEANYDAGIIYVCKDETVYFQNFSKTEGGSALIAHEWRIDGPTGTVFYMILNPVMFLLSRVFTVLR